MTAAIRSLVLVASGVAAGCGPSGYEVWIEYDHELLNVAAWDTGSHECQWYPRVLEGEWSDDDPREPSCASRISEIVVHWPDGREPKHHEQYFGGSIYQPWAELPAGAPVTVEVRGSDGSVFADVAVPTARPELVATVAFGSDQVAATWTDPERADLACISGGSGFSGEWTCTTDVGGISLRRGFDPQFAELYVRRAWQLPSETGTSIWERQRIALPELSQ
jgi:hypothetical protein